MHELMACVASVLIIALFILQTAANTNTFIEAVYCEKTVSKYVSEEYPGDEIGNKMLELKDELERMPGVRAELNENKMDLYLDGVIGPAKILGIRDNSIHIEKELELKEKVMEYEKLDDNSGDFDNNGVTEQDPDGVEYDYNINDMRDIIKGDSDQ